MDPEMGRKIKRKAFGMTSGIGSMLIGAKTAGFEVLGNVEWRKYYTKETFENYFNAPMVRKLEDFPGGIPKNIDLLMGHPECFTSPFVKIYTSGGWKYIKKIKVGDLVLTHKGRFKKVHKLIRNKKKNFTEIKINISSEKDQKRCIRVTANHPILGKNGKWIKAKSLKVGDEIKFLGNELFLCNEDGKYKFIDSKITFISSKICKRNTTLYNLEVEDDNSYIAKGFVVHNCGNYSNLNISKRRAEKRRNPGDIPLFTEAVAKIKPKFFIMDDLPGSLEHAVTEKDYHKVLPDYDLFFEWVSNHHYGNTQKMRNRFFLIGAKKELKFTFVPGERPNETCVREVIGDLPTDKDLPKINHVHKKPDKKADGFRGHEGEWLTYRQVAKRFLDTPEGRNLYYKNKDGQVKKKIGPCRAHWDKHCYVMTGNENIFHPTTGYPLTIRERARLQGCPDSMHFYGNYTQQIKQTGKFMPVQFCEYVSKQIMAFLKGKPFKASKKRMIAENPHIDKAKTLYCKNHGGYSDWDSACNNCWLKQTCSVREFDLLEV